MDLETFGRLASDLPGVRSQQRDGVDSWRYQKRLVARALDVDRVVVRCSFDIREALLRAFPSTFSVPPRFKKHMMIVADLGQGDDGAIEDALVAAWKLQAAGSRRAAPSE